MRKALLPLLLLAALGLQAQTHTQRGTVRLITHSDDSPIVPVAGVRVMVGNEASKPTDARGAFSLRVPATFTFSGIAGDEYLLALPTRGQQYAHSKNPLEVVVTTKEQQEADYQRLYNQLKRKYREQTLELDDARQECRDLMDELAEGDTALARLQARYDSLQALYLEYLNNEESLEGEIKRIATDLSYTDYRSLDSLERRLYRLKSAGQWGSVSDLLRQAMRGDAEAFIRQGLDARDQARAAHADARQMAEAASRDLAARRLFLEQHIEAFLMQHQRDSVSRYYAILTQADSLNWDYLTDAGIFERQWRGNLPLARHYQERALLLALREGEASPRAALSHSNLGSVILQQGQYGEALAHFELALQIQLDSLGPSHPALASTYNNLGTAHHHLGHYEEALSFYQKALDIWSPDLTDELLSRATCLSNIGLIHQALGDPTEALRHYQQALAIQQRLLGEEHPSVALTYNNMGYAHDAREDYRLALHYYRKALELQRKNLGEQHPAVARSLNNIGSVLDSQGLYDEALQHYQQALAIQLAALGPDHPSVATTYNNIGYTYRSQGLCAMALPYFEKAYGILLPLLPEGHPSLQRIDSNIEACRQKTGRHR